MYKITDIPGLGQEYSISNSNGEVIQTVQVVTQDDILSAALGPFTDEFSSYTDYLEKSISVLSGFEEMNNVLWYATHDEEVVLADVIEFAMNNNYTKIILEHLEFIDET